MVQGVCSQHLIVCFFPSSTHTLSVSLLVKSTAMPQECVQGAQPKAGREPPYNQGGQSRRQAQAASCSLPLLQPSVPQSL